MIVCDQWGQVYLSPQPYSQCSWGDLTWNRVAVLTYGFTSLNALCNLHRQISFYELSEDTQELFVSTSTENNLKEFIAFLCIAYMQISPNITTQHFTKHNISDDWGFVLHDCYLLIDQY